MNERSVPASKSDRVKYAFWGLLAGDAVLFVFLFSNAIRAAALLSAARIGQPSGQIAAAIDVFVFYAGCSFVGWLVVGVPTVLLFPPQALVRLPSVLRVTIGAALGPLALFLIMFALARGHITSWDTFTNTGILWIYAAAVSVTAFLIYMHLLERNMSGQPNSKQDACG